jgi:hypothetical protein
MIRLFPLIPLLFAASPAFADDLQAMLAWGDRVVAKYGQFLKANQPSARLDGLTNDDKPCSLVLIGSVTSHRQYNVALGTSSTGTTNPGDYSWIDTAISPEPVPAGYRLNRLVVGAHVIIIDVFIDDNKYGERINAQNEIEILSDDLNNVTQVNGSSSVWPTSKCFFNLKP